METKPFYQSSTYWGLFVILFSTLAQALQPWGVEVPTMLGDFINNDFVDLATQIGQFAGLIIAARGRSKAQTRISLK